MAAPKLSERRVSQRFTLNLHSQCGHIVFERTIVLPLLDLSYGGFSVATDKPEHESLFKTLPRTSEVELVVLGLSTTGRAIRVFENKQRMGYAFCHDTASVLIFLRRFIEFMRLGEHLNVLNKNLLKPPYDTQDWICFRGDGPTDVVLHKSSQEANTIDEAVITYREKESYRTVEYRKGRFYTTMASDALQTTNRTGQDTQVNEDILRKASCVLMGYHQSCESGHRVYLENLLSAFRKQLNAAPQAKK